MNDSFDGVVEGAGQGDFVYFDPPYDPISKTSNFTTYSSKPFGKPEQEHLARVARDLTGKGAFVVLSNNDTPFVRSLYEDFDIHTVTCARSINSNADRRGNVDELIITSRRS